MASSRLLTFFLFLAFLLLPFSLADDSEKVTVSLYYETLCPACANFIVNHLAEVFKNGLFSIINLRLVPWGNAKMSANGSFICEHGPDECLLNTIDACTIDIYPDVARHFHVVDCIERLVLEQRHDEWATCLQQTGIGRAPVDCYTTGKGNMIEQKHYEETAELNPPHQFVPWVVVKNQPLIEDFENFMTYICRAYKGSPKPDVCSSHKLELNSSEKTSLVCYK